MIDNLKDPGEDEIFGLQDEYRNDKRKNKVNLTIGVYSPEEGGQPPIFTAVKESERILLQQENTKNYLKISGLQEYLIETSKLIFDGYDKTRLAMIQTLGGTSALRIGFEFLRKNGFSSVLISNPTWVNHKQILNNLEYTIHSYSHLKALDDFSVYIKSLESLPTKSIVLLQPMNHNPTGLDFGKEEWKKISSVCREKNLLPFFDSAYQGFGVSLEEDVWPIRMFLDQDLEIVVAHSYCKNFSLYNERAGALFISSHDEKKVGVINRNLMKIVRVSYSNPPYHGAGIISNILKDQSLRNLWEEELNQYQNRIKGIRKVFGARILPIFGNHFSNSMVNGNGFFSQLPLNREEINRLKIKYGVYVTSSGRVCLPGLNKNVLEYVIDSLNRLKGQK